MKTARFICAILVFVFSFIGSWTFAQTSAKLAFEVASIKPLPPIATFLQGLQSGKLDISKLGTTIDKGRVDMGAALLTELIMRAYKIKPNQLVGPDWLGSQLFEIHAKIPEGASKEQVPEMMQTLLEERFKLKAHRENREQPVYALIVSKDGHKLKEATDAAEPKTPPSEEEVPKSPAAKSDEIKIGGGEGQITIKRGGNGMDISAGSGGGIHMNITPNGMLISFDRTTMTQFADALSNYVDRPVVDRTELKGAYQVSFEISMADMVDLARKTAPKLGISIPPGMGASGNLVGSSPEAGGLGASEPSNGGIIQAIQKLGLKLDSRKEQYEKLIIDSIEKTPTED